MIAALRDSTQLHVSDMLDVIGWPKEETFLEAKILVITGDNASGKSLVRRLLEQACRREQIEAISLSMEGRGRTWSGLFYGRESHMATGLNSARVIKNGLQNFRERPNPVFGIYDEPEIGMSEELQHGAVEYIAQQLADWPEPLRGLVFCTHSRIFVEGLMRMPDAYFVNLGDKWPTHTEWLNRKVTPFNLDSALWQGNTRGRMMYQYLEKDT